MDTVEWGSGHDPAEPLARQQGPGLNEPQSRLVPTRMGGRWAAMSLAAAGLAAMMASELLPWTTVHPASTSGTNTDSNSAGLSAPVSLGLDRLTNFSVFAYQLAMLGIFGLLGALLFGRVRQRRAVFGIGAGLFAAQALNLVGIIHSFGHLLDNYLAADVPNGMHTSVEPGAYFAVVGLILLLASLVMTAAPERVRAQLSEVMREPVDAQFTDEPIELTVTQAKPIDEAYFTGPDQRR